MAKQPNTAEGLEEFLREDKYTEFQIQCSGKTLSTVESMHQIHVLIQGLASTLHHGNPPPPFLPFRHVAHACSFCCFLFSFVHICSTAMNYLLKIAEGSAESCYSLANWWLAMNDVREALTLTGNRCLLAYRLTVHGLACRGETQ